MNTKKLSRDGLNLVRVFESAEAWSTPEELETIRLAIEKVSYEELRADGSQVLFDAFEDTVHSRTRTLLRGALYPNEVSPLRHLVNAGDVRIALTFAG